MTKFIDEVVDQVCTDTSVGALLDSEDDNFPKPNAPVSAGLATVLIVAGAVVPAIFWGVWHVLGGQTLIFLGFTRAWIDIISGPFFVIFWLTYLKMAEDRQRKMNEGRLLKDKSFISLAKEHPWFTFFGVFSGMLSCQATVVFSAFAGLVCIVAIATLTGLFCITWKGLKIIFLVFLPVLVRCVPDRS